MPFNKLSKSEQNLRERYLSASINKSCAFIDKVTQQPCTLQVHIETQSCAKCRKFFCLHHISYNYMRQLLCRECYNEFQFDAAARKIQKSWKSYRAKMFMSKPHFERSFFFKHPLYGNLRIYRCKDKSEDGRVNFKISLCGTEYVHSMYTEEHGRYKSKIIEFGYSDINMPRPLQHKGIGYCYHHVAALTAQELNIEYLCVDNVVSPSLTTLLENIGLKELFLPAYYHAKPEEILSKSLTNLERKQWKFIPHLVF